MSATEDDAQLLGAWHNHKDAEAFRIVCERYAGLIEACCRRHGSPDPNEAVQAVFLVLARRAGSVSAAGLGGWLTTTAKRVVKDQHRADNRRRRHEQEAAMVVPGGQPCEESHATWAEARQYLDEALASLSEGRREAILRFYLAGRPQAEVAAELGCSVAAIKMRVHEGLERMRTFYARKGIALSAVALGSGLASEAAGSDPTLIATCVKTVQAPAAAPGAAALAQGIVTTMIIKTATLTAAGLLLAGSCLTSAFVVGAEATSMQAADSTTYPDLKKDGLFGFPQDKATVVCDTKDLRVSAWNDSVYFYVQAVVWCDGDDSIGETEDGRKIGGNSMLLLDVDSNDKVTPNVDRAYLLNPWPSLPGLRYQIELGNSSTSFIKNDSKGRGVIRYAESPAGKVRVDSYLIPIVEIGRKPGDRIKFLYRAESPNPDLNILSYGAERKRHEWFIADRPATFDEREVPDGRDDQKRIERKITKPMPKVGDTPPELIAKDWLNTDTTPTLAGLKGKVVVVDFWATWCGPCIGGIPHLNKLHREYGEKGLVILSISDQSKTGIQNFMKKDGMSMKYVLGTGSEIAKEYGVNGIPYAFIIGKNGKLTWHGNPNDKDFQKQIVMALGD